MILVIEENHNHCPNMRSTVMSIAQNHHIQAFVDILESRPDLFSNQDWTELNQLIGNLPEDANQILSIIQQWLKPESRNHIRDAYNWQYGRITSQISDSSEIRGVAQSVSNQTLQSKNKHRRQVPPPPTSLGRPQLTEPGGRKYSTSSNDNAVIGKASNQQSLAYRELLINAIHKNSSLFNLP